MLTREERANLVERYAPEFATTLIPNADIMGYSDDADECFMLSVVLCSTSIMREAQRNGDYNMISTIFKMVKAIGYVNSVDSLTACAAEDLSTIKKLIELFESMRNKSEKKS